MLKCHVPADAVRGQGWVCRAPSSGSWPAGQNQEVDIEASDGHSPVGGDHSPGAGLGHRSTSPRGPSPGRWALHSGQDVLFARSTPALSCTLAPVPPRPGPAPAARASSRPLPCVAHTSQRPFPLHLHGGWAATGASGVTAPSVFGWVAWPPSALLKPGPIRGLRGPRRDARCETGRGWGQLSGGRLGDPSLAAWAPPGETGTLASSSCRRAGGKVRGGEGSAVPRGQRGWCLGPAVTSLRVMGKGLRWSQPPEDSPDQIGRAHV